MSDRETPGDAPRHPIQVVARRTGLTADLLRAWEKRYGAVRPARSPKNRRLYSDADVHRLRLLRQVTLMGRRIGDVSRLDDDALAELAATDQRETIAAPGTPGGKRVPLDHRLEECLERVRALDGEGLEKALGDAAVELAPQTLVEGLIAPLLTEVGESWRRGDLRVAHEHLATATVRSFLGTLRPRGPEERDAATELVVTTPLGHLHELGALMAAIAAALDGWRVTYLGPNLPAEEIASAARGAGARAVALSLVYPPDDSRVDVELRRLRTLLGDETAILVGGAGAGGYASTLEEVDAMAFSDLGRFRDALAGLRAATFRSRG